MKTENFKKTKMEEKVMQGVSALLRMRFSDARLHFVSITKVELTADFSLAHIYWDTFNEQKKADVEEALSGICGKMRSHLATYLKIRHTPHLKFIYDDQFESEKAITNLLQREGHSI